MTPFSSVQDEMAKLPAEANAAVFTPSSPLDLLSLAELRHSSPELALQLATASGRDHDRRTGEMK